MIITQGAGREFSALPDHSFPADFVAGFPVEGHVVVFVPCDALNFTRVFCRELLILSIIHPPRFRSKHAIRLIAATKSTERFLQALV